MLCVRASELPERVVGLCGEDMEEDMEECTCMRRTGGVEWLVVVRRGAH